jgi:hypothetical protein
MKIKFTLLIVLVGLSSLYSYSQTLLNTTWSVYYPNKAFYAYFHFGTDTLSYSYDNVSYTSFSAYNKNGNDISFVDLPSKPGATTDIGNYTFTIQNDSLRFNFISDVFDNRRNVLTMCYWVSSKATGINTPDFTTSIKFYPNPLVSTTNLKLDKSINNATLTFYNSVGHSVKQIKNITGQTFTINRDNLPCGVYFIRLTHDNKTIITEKLIIRDDK